MQMSVSDIIDSTVYNGKHKSDWAYVKYSWSMKFHKIGLNTVFLLTILLTELDIFG